MTEVDKRQELSLREVELIRELAQIRKVRWVRTAASDAVLYGQKACCQYQIRRNDIQYGLHPAV